MNDHSVRCINGLILDGVFANVSVVDNALCEVAFRERNSQNRPVNKNYARRKACQRSH